MPKQVHNSKLKTMPPVLSVAKEAKGQNSKLRLWPRWMLAVTLGGVLAVVVVYLGAGGMGGALFLPGVLAGACVLAACETWALRPMLRQDRWLFFAATALGAGWGALVVIVLGVASIMGWTGPFGGLNLQYALPLGGAILGALLSVAQWLVLRRRSVSTSLWVPTHVVAGAVAATIMHLTSGWLGGETALWATLVAAAPASVIAGTITGLAVARLK